MAGRLRLAILAAAVIVAGVPLTIDGAASGVPPVDSSCQPSPMPYLGMACLRPDGLFDVVLDDGTRMQTHGPDPLPPPGDIGFGLNADQRPPVCATTSRMHILYGHAAGSPDRSPQVAEDLRAAVRRMNAVLNADGLESGGITADFRVACDAAGDILVDVFAGPSTGGNAYTTDFTAVVNAARAAGHKAADADYLIFYDDTSDGVCGVGNLASDDSLSASNENMAGPDYGVAYKNCWFGRTPMHENGHNQGAVQDLAPDWDLSGHCLEGIDVMCYPTSSILVLCGDRTHYDCDHDTYFDAAPEAGEWLATRWNIGSPLNRYIAFNFTAPPPASNATAEAPPANGTAGQPGPAPHPSSSTSSSLSKSASKTSTAQRTPDRVVADSPPPSASRQPMEPVTIEIPAAPWQLAVAALGALALGRNRRDGRA